MVERIFIELIMSDRKLKGVQRGLEMKDLRDLTDVDDGQKKTVTYKTVKARFWPWLHVTVLKPFDVVPLEPARTGH